MNLQTQIKKKGVTRAHIAKMVGTDAATLSRILSGKQEYVSDILLTKIKYYLASINTDDKTIFKNMSNKFD